MYLTDVTSYKIDFSKQEVLDVAFDIKRTLLDTVETHWFFHFKSGHKENDVPKEEIFVSYIFDKEKERMSKLDFMFGLVGYNYITKSLDSEIKEIFRKKMK